MWAVRAVGVAWALHRFRPVPRADEAEREDMSSCAVLDKRDLVNIILWMVHCEE